MNESDLRDFTLGIDRIVSGYQHSEIMRVAIEANIFDLLTKLDTAEAVAAEVHWQPRTTRMLLDGLVALGLVEKTSSGYANAAVARACLVSGSPAFQGNIIRHKLAARGAWARLDECLKTGKPVMEPSRQRAHLELRNFILGMADIGKMSARKVVDALDVSAYRSILDLGGGPATYGIAFLEANKQMRATVFDMPEVIEIAREQVEAAGLSDRFSFIAGDMHRDGLGDGYDLVFVSNIIHSCSAEVNRALLEKCRDVMIPGGLLIVKDFLTENDRSGPPFSLIFALHMLVHTDGGDTYSIADVAGWTKELGFENGRLVDLTEQSRLWLANKPR